MESKPVYRLIYGIENAVAAASRGLSEGGLEPGAARPVGASHERYRVRPEDERCEGQAAAEVQNREPVSTRSLFLQCRKKGCGNDGAGETMENQEQVFHRFHRPLEISPQRRDFHIPTARLRPAWESGKPKSGFPLSHAGLAKTTGIPTDSNLKTKKGSRPLRGLHILTFQDHSVLETNIDFRSILGLEKASPSPTHTISRKDNKTSRSTTRASGSHRIGITSLFGAHPALESKPVSRLIYGLENAPALGA